MGYWKLAGSTAVVALLSGTGAFADVTPEDVWQNWQDMAAATGQTIAAESAERDGDDLVVSGVSITMDKDGVKVDGSIETMTFSDQGDGTVELTMSDSFAVNVTSPAAEAGGAPTDLAITVSLPGAVTIASGTPEAIGYALTAPQVDASFTVPNAADASKTDATVTLSATNLTETYSVEVMGEARKVAGEFAAEAVTFAMTGTDAEAQSDVDFTMTAANVGGKFGGNFLGAEAMEDMAAALKAGFAMDFALSYGATSFDLAVTEATGPSKITGTAEGGDMSFAMDINRLQYGASGRKAAFAMSSPDIPFPEMKLGYDEATFNLVMPVSKSDQPADFVFLTRLVGLTVSEEIWAMADPTGQLPHDPATLIVDTKGQTTLTADLMDTAAMEGMGEASPFLLNALDILELKLAMLGAELTGAGSFTFDNSDMTTFAGVPAPTGKVELKLTGANALIDKAVAMGLITQDDAAGYKMMVSMFANVAPDKDEMTSTLEFKDKGFYANGQRLQ